MKITVDLSKDLHPVGQIIMHFLHFNKHEQVIKYFPKTYVSYINGLIKLGYIINKEADNYDLSTLILNKSKLKKLLGELETSEFWIEDYRELFKGKKAGSMGTKGACVKKMDKFIKETGHSKEVIMSATQRYINSNRENGYSYLQQADYFIYKNESYSGSAIETSKLATYCEEIELLGKDEILDKGWNIQTI